LAILAGLLPECRDTHDAKHLTKLLDRNRGSAAGFVGHRHSGRPLTCRNTSGCSSVTKLQKPPAEERAMTLSIKSYPFVDKVIDIFGDWLKHRQEVREMRELDAGEFSRIAHELCLTPGDLDTFVRQGPHAISELPKLLKALSIDEKALARSQPLVLRDMERVCASCVRKAQCDQDLDAGTSDQHYEKYCLNASTIDALDENRSRTVRYPSVL
jgi:hypothetical protein